MMSNKMTIETNIEKNIFRVCWTVQRRQRKKGESVGNQNEDNI